MIPSGAAPDLTLETIYVRDLFRKAWEALDPRSAQVMRARCLGLSNNEVAARIGVTNQAVRGRVHVAMKKLSAARDHDKSSGPTHSHVAGVCYEIGVMHARRKSMGESL